jgi:ornithine carbamoyltransferase
MRTVKHLLSLFDFEREELRDILELAARIKRERGTAGVAKPLAEKSVAMIFSKSSTRTRISFQVGIYELGGHSMFFDKNQLQLGRGESVSDTAQVLSRYAHGLVVRTHAHEELETFASVSAIPVINALTDRFHPCQLVADLQTIQERAGRLDGIKVAFLGDGASNMANSWAIAADLAGIDLIIGAPAGYQPADDILSRLNGPGRVTVTDDPAAAARDADFVYTDVWVSMGFEDEATERIATLQPYQVNDELLSVASDDVLVMHCLPAYRGKEISAEVLDGPRSIVWDEAENRLHAQKAIMWRLIGC